MSQDEKDATLRQLQRLTAAHELMSNYISNLKERMSALGTMLGTQMVQIAQMQKRIDRIEAIARQSRGLDRNPDPLPEIH